MADQTTTKQTTLHELLADSPSNWGRWGPNDEIGALNFLTPAEVLRGIQSVKQGKVITIGMAIGNKGGDPVWPGRMPAQRLMTQDKSHYVSGKLKELNGGLEYADDFVVMFHEGFNEPGLSYSKELVQWFYEMEIPALCTDTIANETTVHKESGIVLPLHAALMRNLGVALNEICDLEELSQSCAEDKQYDFLYAAAPIKFKNATGSPV